MVYDVCAGIGPFSVPAAKMKCVVLANDLNPESYKWLNENIKLNKVKQEVKTFNMDGREFVREHVKCHMLERWMDDTYQSYKMHIIMNLPALAVSFLDVFPGLFSPNDLRDIKLFVSPTIHCYTFSKSEDPEIDVRERVESILGSKLPEHSIRTVRNVAPNKEMMYITFQLTRELLTRCMIDNEQSSIKSDDKVEENEKLNIEEPQSKKMKT